MKSLFAFYLIVLISVVFCYARPQSTNDNNKSPSSVPAVGQRRHNTFDITFKKPYIY